jgi:hypothetical protein
MVKEYEGVEVQLHSFLTCVLHGMFSFTLWPLYPGERKRGTLWVRAGWAPDRDALEKRQTSYPCWDSNHIQPSHYVHWAIPAQLNENKTGNVRVTSHLGAFVQPLFQWNRNKFYIFWVCVCSLRYSACNTNALYCHLWPVRLYSIVTHYLINYDFREENVTEHKNLLWFSLSL